MMQNAESIHKYSFKVHIIHEIEVDSWKIKVQNLTKTVLFLYKILKTKEI